MHTTRLFAISALLVTLLLTACQPIQAPAGTPSAPGTDAEASAATINDVTIVANEYSFEGPESIPAGWTRFTLDNQGALSHDLQLFKVEEGKTTDDVMAALQEDAPPDWAEFYGDTTAGASESNWFAVNLEPGSYMYISFGEAEEGPPDAMQGMIGTLTVTESTEPISEVAPIEEDVSIEFVDYQFVVRGTIGAGEHILRVSNTGTELHEAVMFKLHEGTTMEDFMALLEQEMGGESMPEDGEASEAETTPESGTTPEANTTPEVATTPATDETAEGAPPAEESMPEIPADFAGSVILSPGRVTYKTQDFETGTYLFICFIPSPENEMLPHFALGMVQQIIVE